MTSKAYNRLVEMAKESNDCLFSLAVSNQFGVDGGLTRRYKNRQSNPLICEFLVSIAGEDYTLELDMSLRQWGDYFTFDRDRLLGDVLEMWSKLHRVEFHRLMKIMRNPDSNGYETAGNLVPAIDMEWDAAAKERRAKEAEYRAQCAARRKREAA